MCFFFILEKKRLPIPIYFKVECEFATNPDTKKSESFKKAEVIVFGNGNLSKKKGKNMMASHLSPMFLDRKSTKQRVRNRLHKEQKA